MLEKRDQVKGRHRFSERLAWLLPALCLLLVMAAATVPLIGQKEADAPTALVSFVVLKDDTGKPVRNAAVILHPVNTHGKQERGGLELKTNQDGQASFDGLPLGPMLVQVIAPGFQTYGEDFDVKTSKLDVTIRLKRPKQQYSIYDDHSAAKKDAPAPDGGDKKPPQ
jgi:hypothetical protein